VNRAFLLAMYLGLSAAATQVMAEEPATPAAPAAAAPAAPAAPAATTPTEKATPPAQQASVARAIITTGISQREPTDDVSNVGSEVTKVYFFTELHGMQGEHITHRWEHDGKTVSEVGFDVKSPRWRVWSSKSLQPDLAGKWTVKVLNNAGDVLATRDFTYASK